MKKIIILTFGILLCFISFSSTEDDERLKTILNELTQVSNEYIKIFVRYYSDKKSVIEIYLPENIIEKIESTPKVTTYFQDK